LKRWSGRRAGSKDKRERKSMLQKLFVGVWVIGGALLAANHSFGAEPADVKAAAEKSLALLQECGPKFFLKSGCIACHQQSVTSLAVAEARKRGLKVDEKTAREQIHVTVQFVKTTRERFLERSDQPGSSAPGAGYVTL